MISSKRIDQLDVAPTLQITDVIAIVPTGTTVANKTTLGDLRALVSPILPAYVNDAAADADILLLSGSFYTITGNRTIFQKP